MSRQRLAVIVRPALAAALLAACHGTSTNPTPVYSVDRSGADWIASFTTEGTIRVHLKCGNDGYITSWVGPSRPIHIHPGQRIEWEYAGGAGAAVTPLPDLDHC